MQRFLTIIHDFIRLLIFIHITEYKDVYLSCEGNLFTSVFMNNIIVLLIFHLVLGWTAVALSTLALPTIVAWISSL